MAEFDPGRGGMLGTNDLQQTVDRFTSAVNTLTSTVSNMATSMSSGMTRSPSHSANAEGATFSAQPGMGAVPARFTGGYQAGVIGGSGGASGGSGGGSGQGAPTLNQMAAGGNGAYNWRTGWQTGPRTQAGTFGSIGPQPYSGGPGGPGTPGGPPLPPYVNPWSMMGGAAGGLASTAYGATQSGAGQFVIGQGMSQLGNMQLFNAYGQQMTAQWGGPAQGYQNAAFGNGINGVQNNAAAGNAQSAASEFGTLTQLAGGANVTSTAAFGATNALAFANQGLGAGGAAQLAAQIYNPQGALRMQLLTGVSAYGANGKQNSLGSIVQGLAGQGYIGGGALSGKGGSFNQTAFNASFATGRGTSYMNLSALGYSQPQIQDIQSTLNQVYSTASKNHVSADQVFNTIGQAQYGQSGQTNNANSQLAKWGINLSTIQKQGNAASQNLSQQQSESSTFNDSVSAFTSGMQKLTGAVNWFLDKTGLNKVVGGVTGAGAGYQSSGASTWVNGAASLGTSAIAGFGGGAASVSPSVPMTSQGRSTGSSMSSGVPGNVATAVKDAEAQVGKPYVYGGSSPATSFDCSGLVMWAYEQAGVKLPRTSQAQWASLQNKSVALSQVREGDIVFSAGSDGTANAPGHEALMISGNQIVEAPYTGANIRIRGFNPGEWQHAARPAGGTGNGGTTSKVSGNAASGSAGNSGASLASLGTYGSTEEVDAISSALTGAMGLGGSSLATSTNGSATSTGAPGRAGTKGFSGGGNSSQNQALAQKMAAALYGWSGSEWSAGLYPLWTQESGFQTKATNPSSGAYGIPQSLPAGKMASAGADYLTNPATQEKWGLGYIKDRYGDPLSAERHEKAYGWYGTGGAVIVGDRGPEMFVPNQSGTIMSAKDTSNLLRGRTAQTAQAPWTSTPAAQLLLDALTPANNHSRAQSGGSSINVTFGDINIGGAAGSGAGTAAGIPGVNADVNTLTSAFENSVRRALQSITLHDNIAQGVTG